MDDPVSFLRAQLDREQRWWETEPPDRTGQCDRALREIAAKRAIVARHGAAIFGGISCCVRCTEGGGIVEWPCADVRDLTAVYSDQPGYRADWA